MPITTGLELYSGPCIVDTIRITYDPKESLPSFDPNIPTSKWDQLIPVFYFQVGTDLAQYLRWFLTIMEDTHAKLTVEGFPISGKLHVANSELSSKVRDNRYWFSISNISLDLADRVHALALFKKDKNL
jgi:hypothetical protein